MKRGICRISENGVGVIFKEPSADNGMNISANGFNDECGDDDNEGYCKLYNNQKLRTEKRYFFVLQKNPPCIKIYAEGFVKITHSNIFGQGFCIEWLHKYGFGG